MLSKSFQRKPAKHKKTLRDRNSEQISKTCFRKNHLKTKKRRSGLPKRVRTPRSHYSSRHEPLVLIRSCLLSSLPLCTKRVCILRQLRSRSYQSIKLNQIPRTKLIRSRRKQTKNSLPKQTLWSTKFCLVLVSSPQIRKLYSWMVWKLELYCQNLLSNCVVKLQKF